MVDKVRAAEQQNNRTTAHKKKQQLKLKDKTDIKSDK